MEMNEYDVKVEYRGDIQWHNTICDNEFEAEREALYEFKKSRRLTKVSDSDFDIEVTFIKEVSWKI
jgi:hypothetical protein